VLVVTTSVFDKRRAERFAQLLDEAAGARRHHTRAASDNTLSSLVTLANRVSSVPLTADVDAEFRTGLRASLMARIEREGIGVTAISPEAERPRRRIGRGLTTLLPSARARGVALVALAGGTLAISGVSAASADSKPGDALYAIKRSTEHAQLAFAGSDVSRGQLYLDFAKERLTEADAVVQDAAGLTGVLNDMDNEMLHGTRLLTSAAVQRGDEAGLQAIEQFVAAQRPTIVRLATEVRGAARSRVIESLTALDEISTRVEALKQTIKCKLAVIGVDRLGAQPRPCAQSGARNQSTQSGTPTQQSPGQAPGGKPVTVPGIESSVEADTPTATPTPSSSSSSGGLLQQLGKLFGNLVG
jgi:Domain of unknown function (DUF5667)